MTTTRPARPRRPKAAATTVDVTSPTTTDGVIPSNQPFTFASSLGTFTVPSLAVAEGAPNLFALKEAAAQGRQSDALMMTTKAKTKDQPEVWAILLELPNDELAEFHAAWATHSGLDAGK